MSDERLYDSDDSALCTKLPSAKKESPCMWVICH